MLFLNTTQKRKPGGVHQINKSGPHLGSTLLQLAPQHTQWWGQMHTKTYRIIAHNAYRLAGLQRNRNQRVCLPCFQADQGVLHSLLVKSGHVLMHVGVVVPNISFCAAVRYCAKSERRGIVVRSLKLEGWETEKGEVRHHSVLVRS